jgi:hypothetical protein
MTSNHSAATPATEALADGQPVTVVVQDGRWGLRPATTVLLVGRAAGGPVADCCCPFINFHNTQEAAEAYRRAHPGMTGRLFGQTAAVQAARQAFGGLLDPSNPQEERTQ